jgi:hypothetical protein
LLTRPYESIILFVAVVAYLIRQRPPLFALVFLIPAIAITLMQNKAVTGSFTTLPYQLSQYQYGVPAALTFQNDPIPHRELTREQQLEYKSQMAFKGADRETIANYLLRLEYRVRFYRFFFLPPLYLALLYYRRNWFVPATLLLFALGINFFPAFQFHYLAAVTCLFVLMSVAGLERLSQINAEAAKILVFLCVAYFGFWYTLHIFDKSAFSQAMRQYETWDGLNHQNPARRIFVRGELPVARGKFVVFVRYSSRHIFQDEWVYNAADIDAARIVWARDLGAEENAKLRAYYPDRTALLLEPDSPTPELTPYE